MVLFASNRVSHSNHRTSCDEDVLLCFFPNFPFFFSARPLIVFVSQKQGDGICFLILVALSNMTMICHLRNVVAILIMMVIFLENVFGKEEKCCFMLLRLW